MNVAHKTLKIHVSEIEHSGDLENAVFALGKAGFKNVSCLTADYDSECATFRCEYDDGQNAKIMLEVAGQHGLCI